MFAAFLAFAASMAIQFPEAEAQTLRYLCLVESEAGIKEMHLENSGSPVPYEKGNPDFSFVIEIILANPKIGADSFLLVNEVFVEGVSRAVYDFGIASKNQILFSPYVGRKGMLRAKEDAGFLRFSGRLDGKGAIKFWHSGFQYPGGEDVSLVVRYGSCSVFDEAAQGGG